MTSSSPSQALMKRHSDTDLMPPPPPPKRIKRPPKVLDEDEYTDALSHIIARDFFPGLLETQVQQDYLDALASRDKGWIKTAGQRLEEVMTPGPGQRGRGRRGVSMTPRATPMATPTQSGKDTPRNWAGGDTPMSVVSTASASSTVSKDGKPMRADVENMSLGSFQGKYTSEDNESFNKLLDKQNEKRREKYAWMWRGNKIPRPSQIAYRKREEEQKLLKGEKAGNESKELILKTDLDARPAKPDAWREKPENPLMFIPSSIEDTHETVQQKAEADSRAGPKQVLYRNTRVQPTPIKDEQHPSVPPSPSLSAIRDAIAGRPRPTDSEPGYAGGETPRVNGYAFVDEDEPEPSPPEDSESYHLRLLASTTDPNASSSPNPFKLQETRSREALHHRMVERVARTKRAEKVARDTKTPVPRFPSSPMIAFGRTPSSKTPASSGVAGTGTSKAGLTPAAQRLWASVGNSTPRRGDLSSSSSALKNTWTPTPKRK